ncbi:hypothetical protein M3484_19685 [Pseudomonas sp. GX19020]|uniref:hypothetical protein n=1 Tax=Pseudomonas sp. GX19020 TaxID=2942277 RepID=UPI002018DF81|nr:hypothetical protein [Pseudomonas sp. GX19020]MCL4068789.1 hypothetical protein [Pseudomonas sp. GX19020]
MIYTYPNAAARGQWLEEPLGSISLTGPGPVALADLLAIPAPVPAVPDALAQALGAAASAQAAAESTVPVLEDRLAAEAASVAAAGSAAQTQVAAGLAAAEASAQIAPAVAAAGSAQAAAAASAAQAQAALDAAIAAGTWNYTPVDNAALAAITGMTAGQTAYVRQTMHVWSDNGSAWVDTGESPLAGKAEKADLEQVQSQIGDIRFAEMRDPTLSFAATDEDGNSSPVWRFNHEGDFSEDAYGVIAAGVVGKLPPATLDGIRAEELPKGSGYGFAVTDENGSTAPDLSVDEHGYFLEATMQRIFTYVMARMPVADLWDRPPERLLTIGDSLTAGATATTEAARWRNVLSVLTGIPHDPMGVGGETARTITSRTSALSMLAAFPGNEIPAATAPVDVTLTYQDGAAVAPLVQGSLGVNPVEICGVVGNLSRVAGPPVVYRFTRSVAGAAVTMPSPSRVKTAAYDAFRGGFPIIGIGQNGGYVDLDDLIRMNWAMINWTSQGRAGRFLVWTRTGVNAATNAEMEARYQKEFGPRFVNIRAMLSSLWAFKTAGITPTQADLDAIGVGSIPPSFLSDAVHHNDAGQYVIAVCFYLAGVSLSYWS